MKDNHEDFVCTKCSLKFGSNFVYGLHLKLVHGKKNKSKLSKNESKRKKSVEGKIREACVAKSDLKKPIASVHGKKNSFKCGNCDLSCSNNAILKRHVASFHDRKKPFKCEISNYSFAVKSYLKKHIVSIHERKLLK